MLTLEFTLFLKNDIIKDSDARRITMQNYRKKTIYTFFLISLLLQTTQTCYSTEESSRLEPDQKHNVSHTSITIESPSERISSPPQVLPYQLLVKLFDARIENCRHKYSAQLNVKEGASAAIARIDNVYYCHLYSETIVDGFKKLLSKYPDAIIAKCGGYYNIRPRDTLFKPDNNEKAFLVNYRFYHRKGKKEKEVQDLQYHDFAVRMYQPEEEISLQPVPYSIKPLPIPKVAFTPHSNPLDFLPAKAVSTEGNTIVSPRKDSNSPTRKPLPLPKKIGSSSLNSLVKEDTYSLNPNKVANLPIQESTSILPNIDTPVIYNQLDTKHCSKPKYLAAPEKIPHDLIHEILSARYIGDAAEKVPTSFGSQISHKLPLGNSDRYIQLLSTYPNAVAFMSGIDEKRPVNTLGEQYDSVTARYELYTSDDNQGTRIDRSTIPVVVSKLKDVT